MCSPVVFLLICKLTNLGIYLYHNFVMRFENFTLQQDKNSLHCLKNINSRRRICSHWAHQNFNCFCLLSSQLHT